MKCDKLKAEPMIINDDYTALYYPKESVDAAITELKQKLEDAKATAYAESVDAGMRERKLKRALWLTRANRAMMTLDYFTLKCRWFKDYMKVEPPKSDVKMISKWTNVERKCRAKADEDDNGLG